MKAASKKVKTSLHTPSGKIVYRKKIGGKTQAVNYSGNPVVVAATKSAIKRAHLPQRVQAKSMMKEGYNNRAHNSLGMVNKGKKKQSFNNRNNDRRGEKRAYRNSPNLI